MSNSSIPFDLWAHWRFSRRLFYFLISSTSLNAARPTAARLLPENTVVMVSVPDVKDLGEKFMNTNLGRMSQDPQMKPVIEQLYGSMGELVDKVKDKIGLSLAEIVALPQGEITVGDGRSAGAMPGRACSFSRRATKSPMRESSLSEASNLCEMNGSTKREETIGEVKCTIYRNSESEAESI